MTASLDPQPPHKEIVHRGMMPAPAGAVLCVKAIGPAVFQPLQVSEAEIDHLDATATREFAAAGYHIAEAGDTATLRAAYAFKHIPGARGYLRVTISRLPYAVALAEGEAWDCDVFVEVTSGDEMRTLFPALLRMALATAPKQPPKE